MSLPISFQFNPDSSHCIVVITSDTSFQLMFLTIADWKILDTTVKSRFIDSVNLAYTTYVVEIVTKSGFYCIIIHYCN